MILPITHKENGVQVLASTRDYRAQIRRDAEDTTVSAAFDIDTSTDIIVLTLLEAVTRPMADEYVWELEDVTSGRTLIAGSVRVSLDSSRE